MTDYDVNNKRVSLNHIKYEYKRLSGKYEKKWKRFNRASRKWIINKWPKSATCERSTVLDLGCGNGALLALLAKRYPKLNLMGVDVSPDMLDIAKRQKIIKSADLIEHDLETFEAPEIKFDVILSVNVMHHLSDHSGHLKMIKSSLKEDGTAFLCDFAINTIPLRLAERWWEEFHPGHNRAYHKDTLHQWLQDSGFKIHGHSYLKPDLFWRLQIYKLGLDK
jgi:cyclopropane fatty-acyl-phospholipid synthase-like methyltransferase